MLWEQSVLCTFSVCLVLSITCTGWALDCGTDTCRSRRAADGPSPLRTRRPLGSAPPLTGWGSGPLRDTPSPGGCWSHSDHLRDTKRHELLDRTCFPLPSNKKSRCFVHLPGLPCCQKTTSPCLGVHVWQSSRSGWFRCTSQQRETSAGGCGAGGPPTGPLEHLSSLGCEIHGSCGCGPDDR